MRRTPQSLTQSFKSAFRGLRYAVSERSFFIQLIAGIIALYFMIVLPLSRIERVIIILLVAIVLAMEIFNTAIEVLLDYFSPDPHPHIARIKELLAAGVFLMSLAALIIGIFVFMRALAIMP